MMALTVGAGSGCGQVWELWMYRVYLVIMALGQTLRFGPPLAAVLINSLLFSGQCHSVRFELTGCFRKSSLDEQN